MSACILPFTGQWQGRFKPATRKGRADARGFHDARLIAAAKEENDDWTARLLLALLQTLDRKQLELIEFRLLGPELDNQSAVQALAIVQLVTGDKLHRDSVKDGLAALERKR